MALFSINKTIVGGFVIALAIICFFAGQTYVNMHRSEQSNLRVESILQSLRLTESIYDNIQEIETGQRGYIISGDKRFLEPYHAGIRQLKNDTIAFKELNVHEDADRKAEVQQLLGLVQKKIAFTENIIDLRDKKGFESAEAEVRLGLGKQLKDSLHAMILHIEGEDRVFLEFYSDRRAQMTRQTTFLFIVVAGLFILFLAFFFWWMRRDVKKRLRAELSAKVEENTIAFKDILDRISDGFMAFDRNWNFVYINNSAENSFGRDELLGKNIWAQFPDAVNTEFHEACHQAMRSQEYVYLEAYYPHSDVWFENHIYPSAYGLSVHSRNITEKKKIEFKLQQAVERFNTVASATNDILWEADLLRKTTWWNDNFYEKFGYDKNADFTAGDMWDRLLHPDDKKRVLDNINNILYNTTEVSWIDEYRFRRADGTYAGIYDRCYILRDAEGKAYKVIGSMTDISMLQQASEKLRVTEDRYRLMVEGASDAIFITDNEGKLYEVNKRAGEMFGYTENELRGMNISSLIPPEESTAMPLKYRELQQDERISLEQNMLRADGSTIAVDITASMLSDKRIIAIVRDITERKKAQELLAKNEEELKLIYNASSDVIFLIAIEDNQKFRLRSVNKTFLQATGLSEDKVVGKYIDDAIPADSLRLIKKKYEEAIQTGKAVQWEETSVYPTGIKTGIVTVSPVFDNTGRCTMLVGSVHDITERKRIEEEIKDSEEKRRLIMNGALDAIISVDADGRIIFWNPQAEKIFGWKEDEMKGRQLAETIIPERYRERHIRGLAHYGHTGEAVILNRLLELSAINKEGKEFEIEMSILPVVQEGTTTFTAFIRDITEAKKAAENLRLSVERFETIATATHDAIWEWNLETGELWANEVHQELYGVTKNDPVATVDVWKSRIHPDDLDKTSSAQDMALRSDINYWESEYRFRKSDGSYVMLFDRCYIVRDRMHRPVRLTGSMIDVTKRKKAEEDVRESEEKYRSVIEQASDFIMITDNKGNFIDANSNFLKTFGYSKEEFVGLNVRDVIDPEQLRVNPVRFDLLMKGESILNERRMIDRNGNVVEVEANVKMLPDGRILAIARDIRDRKKAQEELTKARGLADKLIDALPGVFYFYDDTGKFIRWNREFEMITGYSAEEIAVMHPTQFFPEEEKEYIAGRIQTVFEKGINDAEANFLTKSGKKIPHYFKAVLLNYEGKPCLLGSGIDISERKQAEEELRQSEQKYKLLFNHNPLPLWMATIPELDIVDVNESAIRHYGYSREEFLKLNAKDLRPEEDVAHFVAEVGKMLPGINNTRIWRHKKKDGTIIHVEIFSHEIVYEGRKVWLGLSNDITVKVEAEEALRYSEKKYKLLFENNPMPMWMISLPTLDIIDVNDSAIKHYGYSREEFMNLNTVDMRPAEDISRYLEMARAELPGVRNAGIWRHKKKDGTLIDVEVISHDIPYGDMPARLVLSNDITEKLKAEKLLKKSLDDIRRLTEHLQTIREEERAHIAREIHDELGQQLTVLKMDVSWLNKKIQSDPVIKEKLNELTAMLDGTVKTVRRISSELRPSLLDDLGLIAAMDWHLKEFEKRTGILTEFREPDSGLTLADNVTTGLFRIFQESLTNVTRHAQADNVQVSLLRNNGNLVLKIQDDGKGFDKEKQANKRTLGILGMKERTEMMGGRYEISSVPGRGTTVVVSIPNQD